MIIGRNPGGYPVQAEGAGCVSLSAPSDPSHPPINSKTTKKGVRTSIRGTVTQLHGRWSLCVLRGESGQIIVLGKRFPGRKHGVILTRNYRLLMPSGKLYF